MSAPQYTVLPAFYDRLNHADYDRYAVFLDEVFRRYGVKKGTLVLDLACGTGSMTLRLSDLGYDLVGVDLSREMLAVAYERAADAGKQLLFLQQDMRELELYGTVGATVCCLDSLNYLTRTDDLARCFASVHWYSDPDALFVFDLNTPYQLQYGYGAHDCIMEEDGILLAWRSVYHAGNRCCDFDLSFFCENPNGTYTRMDEHQTERAYADRTVITLLKRAGFELLSVVGDTDFAPPTPTDRKHYYICRCRKQAGDPNT